MKITKSRLKEIIREELVEGTIEREYQLYDTEQLIQESDSTILSVLEQLDKVSELYEMMVAAPHNANNFKQLPQKVQFVKAAIVQLQQGHQTASIEHEKKKQQAAQQAQPQ